VTATPEPTQPAGAAAQPGAAGAAPVPAISDDGEESFSILCAQLRASPLFAGVAEADLIRLEAHLTPVTAKPGQRLLEEGAPGDELYLVEEGELEARRRVGRDELTVGPIGPGDVIGEMSVIEGGVRTASVVARTESKLQRLSRDDFAAFLADRPSASLEILRTAMRRLRNTEVALQQREKMAALGTLAAGLTHELNNPAAAAARSADQLAGMLDDYGRESRQIGPLTVDPEKAAVVDALAGRLAAAPSSAGMSPMARADAAEALEPTLDSLGVDNAWELAPALAGRGLSALDLGDLEDAFESEDAAAVVRWLARGAGVHDLLDELGIAVGRISELVAAVKSYAHLDRAPVGEVDVTVGLESTLVILRHKLRDVEIVRRYAPDLPHIEAFPGELNQVWTNLIDNAVDAMDGHGRLELIVEAAPNRVEVSICDDGPGIPEELRSRIFEPFFTTKPVGVGSGLGLHIVYGIVAGTHGGEIKVDSEPGRTCFHVSLPLRLPKGTGARAEEGQAGDGAAAPSGGAGA
jgi:signal transduction histidine kinase